jgi:L-rhamnose isomerase / sugar isomerase
MFTEQQQETANQALDSFRIEVPSWGFANTGTRFGKFLQDSAAITIEEKLADAGQVNQFTGRAPTVAVHVLWDFPNGPADIPEVKGIAAKYGVSIGAINPNVFQDQIYKHGSLGNPDPAVREAALHHILDCIEIARLAGSRDISLWFGDGSNFPGSQNIRHRRFWFEEGLRAAHAKLRGNMRLLVEYKPFEPAFYHTDIADWGMAYLLAKAAGAQARVLVDTGHHYLSQNIEQIVAWLLDEDMLGGFHFNDRRFADDDLTLGSIDPYQVFRIFNEICLFAWERGAAPDLGYVVDQSHNLKNKCEEMIQTVCMAEELFVKASLVDHSTLAGHQAACRLIDAEECLKSAFANDVRPLIVDWRKSKGLPANPLEAFRASGYTERAAQERGERNRQGASSYA